MPGCSFIHSKMNKLELFTGCQTKDWGYKDERGMSSIEESPHVGFQNSRLGAQWRPTDFSDITSRSTELACSRGNACVEKGGQVMLQARAQKATSQSKKHCWTCTHQEDKT